MWEGGVFTRNHAVGLIYRGSSRVRVCLYIFVCVYLCGAG
jgi:hypothetical protein